MDDSVTRASTGKVENQPVRIICRFANGLMQSSVARGISLKGETLTVQTRESMEPGIQVTVLAPFLGHTQPALVISCKRDAEAGTFLLSLSLRRIIAPLAQKTEDIDEAEAGDALRRAADTLSKRLETAGWIPFHQAAFERAADSERGPMLAATEMAVFTLLEEKNLTSLALLKARVERAGK